MGVPISNVTRRVVLAASGTGPYNFTFEILAASDIAVYRDDTLLTLTTDYTVTINSNGTGYVTLVATPTGATQIAIVGNRTIQRTTDFVTGGDFFANTLNTELDSLTIFAQQNAEATDRALKAPQTDPTSIDMTLPRASVRANKTLAFDANGDPTTGEVIGDNRGNWASGVAYNKRDIVKDTSNGNVYYANTSHTSTGTTPISTNADAAKWDLIVDNASATASASAAASSASAAATSASNASTSATNAASSASTASTQASNASTSATNAANSATAAASSASTASTQATNASNSASAAATSATNASNSASAASTSATNAASSASAASTSASNASTSATNAANSATSASSSASTATTQAGIATTQAGNAATSATNAANSATAASNSASAAATSETNAAASAASAASALDSFDDRYLGSKASDPTVDNDGNALVTGALYYNTTTQTMKVYDGANWIAATAAGTSAMTRYRYVATSGQTTFSGADSNALTLSYTSGNIVVSRNGVVLDTSEYTATNGTSIVLASAAALNDVLDIVAFKSFTVADTYTKAEVDTSLAGKQGLDSELTTLAGMTSSRATFLASTNQFGFINRLLNGDMRIDQRNAGASVTPTDAQYTVDRWNAGLTQASKFSVQRSTVAPAGFTNSLLVTSLSAYSVVSGDLFRVSQYIEGFNASDLGWGAAGAQSVTLSFWVRSSLTGTFSGALLNSAVNRSYPFTYTISAANTWEQKSVTIAGDTSGTWLTDSGIGIRVGFSLGAGSTFSGPAGSWAAATYTAATGAVSVVGTNGATFYITGVQLEKGSAATPFDFRSLTQEQQLCSRYYHTNVEINTLPSKGGASYFEGVVSTVVNSGTSQATMYRFPVPMRAAPTVSVWTPNNGTAGQAWSEATQANVTYSIGAGNTKQLGAGTNPTGSAISGNVYYFHYAANAEL